MSAREDIFFEMLQSAARRLNFFMKVVVVLIAVYLVLEVGSAFLPGGVVERVLGGAQ
jgi:hypothetical protein